MTMRDRIAQSRKWPVGDQAAWANAIATADMFGEHIAAGRWRKATWETVAYGYSRWLKYLGYSALSDDAPAKRVTPETVAGYVEVLKERTTPWSQSGYVFRLYSAMLLMAPENDWTWLKNIGLGLHRIAKSTRKTGPVVSVDRLYGLGMNLMAEAEMFPEVRPVKKALLYRDGLMIALLAARPLRRKNLTGLRLGHQLTKIGSAWVVSLSADETKNKRAYETLLPSDLAPKIDRYLAEYRPRFFQVSGHDALWPSQKGGPLDAQGVHKIIVKRTRSAFGVRMYPNLFRVSAATTMALTDPLHAETAKLVLGQVHSGTFERHYNRAQTIDASRRYQGHLEALRARLDRDASHADTEA